MTEDPISPNAPRPAGKGRIAGLAVHAFTATGSVLGLLALLAAIEARFTAMFLWLGLALFVDAIDGAFARRADVKRTAPEISGDILDLVVDYVTYVLVPAYAMLRAGLLPDGFALPAAGVILITSALYFADVRMKTDDWYFRGFPAVWNIFAFLAFVLAPNPWVLFIAVLICAALTFAPLAVVHPMRVTHFRTLTLFVLVLTAVLFALALWWNLAPPPAVRIGLILAGIYFFGVGLLRPKADH